MRIDRYQKSAILERPAAHSEMARRLQNGLSKDQSMSGTA
jgi:hypothetical protein